MKQKIYQVDAFAEQLFKGNPAAVCPLDKWLDDQTLLNIAMENNLAETAFYVKKEEGYEIRWFTPKLEVDLCGHATLASAFVLFNLEGYEQESINFYSPRSGKLMVAKHGEMLELNFPTDVLKQVELSDKLLACFEEKPVAAYRGKNNLMMVFETEDEIRTIKPHLSEIEKLDAHGVIITAKGENTDFVSRYFAPAAGINEDPVTGSAHTTLIPYWAKKLNKNTLTAIQLSERTGVLQCKYLGDRVEIGGYGKLYLEGVIHLQ